MFRVSKRILSWKCSRCLTFSAEKSIHRYIDGFRISKTVFTAVELGIFEKLNDKPNTAFYVASGLKCDLSAMTLLLDSCVSMKLLKYSIKAQKYSLTKHTRLHLLTASPSSWVGYIKHSNNVLFPLWSKLHESVKTGHNQWTNAFGLDKAKVFDNLYGDDDKLMRFMQAMHNYGKSSSVTHSQLIAESLRRMFPTYSDIHIVDVGGGTGHFLHAVLNKLSNVTGFVVDIPRVVDMADNGQFCQLYEGEDDCVLRRMEWQSGDFMTALKDYKSAHCVLLGRILHDWSDDDCVTILKYCKTYLAEFSGLICICDTILDPIRSNSQPFKLINSLNMLVQTEGKERSFMEIKSLLGRAGFDSRNAEVIMCKDVGGLDLVTCY